MPSSLNQKTRWLDQGFSNTKVTDLFVKGITVVFV